MRSLTLEQLTREDVSFSRIQAARNFWTHGACTQYQGTGRSDNMIFFMLEGRRCYRVADGRETFEVVSNDLMLMPAASCYETVVLSEAGCWGINLQFQLTDEAGERCSLGEGAMLLRENSSGLRALAEGIVTSSLQYGSRLRVKALMLELLSQLCASPQTGSNRELLPAVRYLQEHLERPVPVEELATLCHMSLSTFARRFRAAMGETPAAYHRHLRLKKGRELLTSGLYTVENTAQTLGFYDTAHFCHAYAAYFHASPRGGEHREQAR